MRQSTMSLLLVFVSDVSRIDHGSQGQLVMCFGIIFRDSVPPAKFGLTLVFAIASAQSKFFFCHDQG